MTIQSPAVASFIKEQMKNVDLVITTGGVSVGKKDIMHEVISQLEANRLFWRINMRPGTPVLASLYQDKLILGGYQEIHLPLLQLLNYYSVQSFHKLCIRIRILV